MPDKWMLELQTKVGCDQVLFNEPMAKHTTFRVGGPAEVLVKPGSRQQIATVIEVCQKVDVPWIVIGSGSNLLVRSGGIKGVVIDLGANFREITITNQTIVATAGIRLTSLSRQAAQHELTGLEFAEGIPGSLGGAVFMNAGAYDGEISQVVTAVISLDPQTGEEVLRSRDDLGFSYRHSCFQQNGEIILEATMSLAAGKRDEITAQMQKLSSCRREKQPLDFPSAGSTFKRPPGYYVGPLLEELGLKGYAIGGAQVSQKHGGFIINRGGASADDVLALINYVQEQVFKAKGIRLETEVRIVGEP
ncbi:MAG: UDP-N-acetylmuramate dehydrogenase [Methylocystaceae bacterium]